MPLYGRKRKNLLGENLDRAGKKISGRRRAPNQHLSGGAILEGVGHVSQIPRDIAQ